MTIRRLKAQLHAWMRDLHPGSFAMVMATGIVSIAAFLLGMPLIARGLLWINVAAFAVLWLLTLGRGLFYYPQLATDFRSHARGPGFFTLVAGACVLGTQALVLSDAETVARGLWAMGMGLWLVIMYGFFTMATIRQNKPSLQSGINGAWLVAVVATQSISILSTQLLAGSEQPPETLYLFPLSMYLVGCMLYLSIITLIFYRLTFIAVNSGDLTPPYWINMGAAAITTLAGATLIIHAGRWSLLGELLPFLKGFTLLFWATATWWIPLLLILGVWRHVVKRLAMTYDPLNWAMVFPLGMYPACTYQLAQALHVETLYAISRIFVLVALLAWIVTFAGLGLHLTKQLILVWAP